MSESKIFQMLRCRYPVSSHVLLPHVRDSTGTRGQRTADAIAFGLYPSRGLEVEGFEIKVSRSDWLRELSLPEKAESIFKYCDRWWLVVSDEEIVKDGELPSTWGLLIIKNDKLISKIFAPKLCPVSLERCFIASLLRQLQKEFTPNILVQGSIDIAYQSGMDNSKSEIGQDATQSEMLQHSVREFEAASGIKIDRWNGQRIGNAVRQVMYHGTDRAVRQLESLQDSLARTLRAVKSDLVELQEKSAEEKDCAVSND